jgi:hypothetical protein
MAMIQAVNTETQFHFQTSPRGIGGGQSGNVTGFNPGISVSSCQFHSINFPHVFIHLPLTLQNLFN